MSAPAKPELVVLADRLRHAFQSGSDERMLDLWDSDVREALFDALRTTNDRAITYAAPQIAALMERIGYVEVQR